MIDKNTSIPDYFEQVTMKNNPDKLLNLVFGKTICQLKTNSSKLISKLEVYFKDFLIHGEVNPDYEVVAIESDLVDINRDDFTVKTPDVGKTKIKEEYLDLEKGRVIYKRLTGMVFAICDKWNLAIGPCIENDNQVVNFINNRFIENRLNLGYQLGHAASVALGEKGIAIAGFSGMGKSTLSLEIMKKGTDFISNDRVMILKENGKVDLEGVAKHPRINPGTILNNDSLISLIEEEKRQSYFDMGDELWDLEEKYDGFIDKCFGESKFKLKTTLNGLFLLNWNRSDEPLSINKIDLRQREDLLPAFMKETGLFYLPNEQGSKKSRNVQDYISELEGVDVFELSGGVDFEKAANFCYEYLKS